MAGSTGNANLVSSGVQYALFIVFTGAVFFFIETGRRPLLINSALGMGICQFVIGGVLCSYGTYVPGGVLGNLNVIVKVTDGRAHTVIVFVYLLIIVCAVALALVAWVYAAEFWSLETRTMGMALASKRIAFSISHLGSLFPQPLATSAGRLSSFPALCVTAPLLKRSLPIPR